MDRSDGSKVNIPGGAFVDDLIITCDDPEEFQDMIYFFSKFLKACGMALNPDKCHFTSVNCRLPPTIVIPDSKGSPVLVKWRDPSVPLKYLGYWLVPKNHGTKVSEVWRVHNEMVWDKLQNALARFQNSMLRANQVVRIFNSDILSILPFFFTPTICRL